MLKRFNLLSNLFYIIVETEFVFGRYRGETANVRVSTFMKAAGAILRFIFQVRTLLLNNKSYSILHPFGNFNTPSVIDIGYLVIQYSVCYW